MAAATRSAALSAYRRALKIARDWPRLVGDFQQPVDEKTQQEQHYIRTEARKLMHEHAAEQNLHIITKEIQDAHDRMDVAVHYKIPYPRHHHYHGANSKDVREVGGAASVYREIPE